MTDPSSLIWWKMERKKRSENTQDYTTEDESGVVFSNLRHVINEVRRPNARCGGQKVYPKDGGGDDVQAKAHCPPISQEYHAAATYRQIHHFQARDCKKTTTKKCDR
jgi:hypothetical protein